MHVYVKPKLHIHKECGPRFHPLLHTYYTVDCLTALIDEDVSSGYYVQFFYSNFINDQHVPLQ